MNFEIMPLMHMFSISENSVKMAIENFYCPKNKEVEDFLKYKSIDFSKQGLSQTHLVYVNQEDKFALTGYFTLSNKTLKLNKSEMSNSFFKHFSKFGRAEDDGSVEVSLPLIAQLGRDFRQTLLNGSQLLKYACDTVEEAQKLIGGKYVYLECDDTPNLLNFYDGNGFKIFGKRTTDSGTYLLQLLKRI